MSIDLALAATIALGVLAGIVAFTIVKVAFFLVLGLPGTDELISNGNKETQERLSDIERVLEDISNVIQDSARNANLLP